MKRRLLCVAGSLLLCLTNWPRGGNLLAAAPDVTRMSFTPAVVPEHYAQPVRFEATVTGNPAAVAFEYNVVDRPMFDNGTNGDQIAGDGIWTILFQPGEIIGKLTAGSVFRPFIGYCKPLGGGKFNIFAEVWTSSIPIPAVRQLDATTQETNYIVNFVVSQGELLVPDYRALARRFYATYRTPSIS